MHSRNQYKAAVRYACLQQLPNLYAAWAHGKQYAEPRSPTIAESIKRSRQQGYARTEGLRHVCCEGLGAVFETPSAWPPEAES